MKFKALLLLTLATVSSMSAIAAPSEMIDELDPYADNIEEQLLENDIRHVLDQANIVEEKKFTAVDDCYQRTCKVFIDIDKSRQRAQLFIDGTAVGEEWKVSTGTKGHSTPNFDRHPQKPLRIYNKYSSSKYPGGDWKGLGNMPYAVFIKGGFAIHGTTAGNIKLLGTTPRSHGCIRVHPDNGKIFNNQVRLAGADQTWVTVHE